MTQVVVERRRVVPADQISTGESLDHVGSPVGLGITEQLSAVRGHPGLGDDVPLGGARRVGFDHHVVHVGTDHDRQVARQRPRRRGPDQGQLAGLQPQPDGDRRVVPDLVDLVVHPQLVVGQRGLVVPAVGQHPQPFVDESLVVQGLEGPQHALHEREVKGLVVVLEVDPAGLPGDVVLPGVGVAQHRGTAGGVEPLDAHLLDVGHRLQAELRHGLELRGQPVAVPPEPPLDPPAPHGLEARHDVLDVAGQQVTVVRQAVGERRAVVEDELVRAVLPGRVLLHRGPEGVVVPPVAQHPLLQLGEAGARRHLGLVAVAGGRLGIGHRRWSFVLVRPDSCSYEDDVTAAVPPRLPTSARRLRSTARSRAVTGPPVRFY